MITSDIDPPSHAAAATFPELTTPGRLIDSAIGRAIHNEARYRELGGEGFEGYFPACRRAA